MSDDMSSGIRESHNLSTLRSFNDIDLVVRCVDKDGVRIKPTVFGAGFSVGNFSDSFYYRFTYAFFPEKLEKIS
jgi:hypothetical protein